MAAKAERAVRIVAPGGGEALRDLVIARASEFGVLGWARSDGDAVRVHAEGDAEAVEELFAFLRESAVGAEAEEVEPEGHEQFAARGVPAGRFAVRRDEGSGRFELTLEVDGEARAWAVPKEPPMDPSVKRMAIEAEAPAEASADVWDEGPYEQGGRVPWPEAIERGHAVFVLHGARLSGGFALQRTRGSGPGAQWLLIKRRERPG